MITWACAWYMVRVGLKDGEAAFFVTGIFDALIIFIIFGTVFGGKCG